MLANTTILGEIVIADCSPDWGTIMEITAYSTNKNNKPLTNQIIPKGRIEVSLRRNIGLMVLIQSLMSSMRLNLTQF